MTAAGAASSVLADPVSVDGAALDAFVGQIAADLAAAMRLGPVSGWPDHDDLSGAVERLFRRTYEAALLDHWLPALGRPVDRLSYGGKVADVGCGHGSSSVLVAKRYPLASVHGFDPDGPSIEAAQAAARAAGVASRCTFAEVAADDVPASGYDVLLLLGGLRHMADPVRVARRARKVLAPDGVVMVVEPAAGDPSEDDRHPVGRLLHAASMLACTHGSLAAGGSALGVEAGPEAVTQLLLDAGFAEVTPVATTLFSYVLSARPPR